MINEGCKFWCTRCTCIIRRAYEHTAASIRLNFRHFFVPLTSRVTDNNKYPPSPRLLPLSTSKNSPFSPPPFPPFGHLGKRISSSLAPFFSLSLFLFSTKVTNEKKVQKFKIEILKKEVSRESLSKVSSVEDVSKIDRRNIIYLD